MKILLLFVIFTVAHSSELDKLNNQFDAKFNEIKNIENIDKKTDALNDLNNKLNSITNELHKNNLQNLAKNEFVENVLEGIHGYQIGNFRFIDREAHNLIVDNYFTEKLNIDKFFDAHIRDIQNDLFRDHGIFAPVDFPQFFR